MSKKSKLPQSRRHILVYDEDWEYLMRHYGPGSVRSDVGVSRAIREVLHQRVQGLRIKEAGEIDKLRDDQRPTGDDEVRL